MPNEDQIIYVNCVCVLSGDDIDDDTRVVRTINVNVGWHSTNALLLSLL